jgi:hypothetical protein
MKKYLDRNKEFSERKKIFEKDVISKMMNPIPEEEFDPENFDPVATDCEEDRLARRERVKPGKRLNMFGLKPKQIREGQMIGMYESKQDIYLTFADRCNDLQDEVDELRKEIEKLKNDKKR